MFAITTKAKIAAGIAAGALTLGAAGAYAAANANNTTTLTTTPAPVTLRSGSTTFPLVSLNGSTVTEPATFNSAGACVSWLAQDKNLALQSSISGNKLPKSYHGQLMRAANAWCKTQLTTSTKTDAADSETPDATQSAAPETEQSDAAAPQSGASQGHGNGHGKHTQAND